MRRKRRRLMHLLTCTTDTSYVDEGKVAPLPIETQPLLPPHSPQPPRLAKTLEPTKNSEESKPPNENSRYARSASWNSLSLGGHSGRKTRDAKELQTRPDERPAVRASTVLSSDSNRTTEFPSKSWDNMHRRTAEDLKANMEEVDKAFDKIEKPPRFGVVRSHSAPFMSDERKVRFTVDENTKCEDGARLANPKKALSTLQVGISELARSFSGMISNLVHGTNEENYDEEDATDADDGAEEGIDDSPSKPDAHRLKIYIGTWNMYGKPPPFQISPFVTSPDPLPPLLDDSSYILNRLPQHPYHLLVLGTQECQRPISRSVIQPSKEEWEKRLCEVLGHAYSVVRSETMAALHLIVFVWKGCADWVHGSISSSVATGIAGVIGNKGGVGISLKFGTTSFLFVNSHFTAHQGKVPERNGDFRRIDEELGIFKQSVPGTNIPRASMRFDYVFWFGDLNYRVNGTRRIVDTLLTTKRLEVLLANDQLTIERRAGRVFEGFNEGKIEFPPTYKFDVILSPQSAVSSDDNSGRISSGEASSDKTSADLQYNVEHSNVTGRTSLQMTVVREGDGKVVGVAKGDESDEEEGSLPNLSEPKEGEGEEEERGKSSIPTRKSSEKKRNPNRTVVKNGSPRKLKSGRVAPLNVPSVEHTATSSPRRHPSNPRPPLSLSSPSTSRLLPPISSKKPDDLRHNRRTKAPLKVDIPNKKNNGTVPLVTGHQQHTRPSSTASSDTYDTSIKARIPSWTDRILYRANVLSAAGMPNSSVSRFPSVEANEHPFGTVATGQKVHVLLYDALMELTCSDHKPVVGVFSVDFDWVAERELRGDRRENVSAFTPEKRRKKGAQQNGSTKHSKRIRNAKKDNSVPPKSAICSIQ